MTARAILPNLTLDDPSGVIASNGVQFRTSDYAVTAPTAAQLCALAEGRAFSVAELAVLARAQHAAKPTLGVGYGVDANALDQAGWGVVFAAQDTRVAEKQHALRRLLAWRKEEAGSLYREFANATGVQPDETGRAFLARFGDAEGPVAVEKVPYYLLLVATPAEISFAVQTELSSRHAVGRVDFASLDELCRYADAIVEREASDFRHAANAAFFAPANPGDVSTARSLQHLASPLADSLQNKRRAWNVIRQFGAEASKTALVSLVSDERTPSLLFTASHGITLEAGDSRQRGLQGALVTQDWAGPQADRQELAADAYVASDDIRSDANLSGMIAVMFACFTGGTPPIDEFLPLEDSTLRVLTPEPFVAALPTRLLVGGAGAVVGHVERAWSTSFWRPGAGMQIKAFEELMLKLSDGWRVGAALDVLNVKCNEIANSLANALRLRKFGKRNDDEVAELVLARTDAANYVIVGDPAVRLMPS